MDSARLDRWLWSIRLFKTRSAAADACKGGRVRVNGETAKPATHVRVGDEVQARVGGRQRIVEVARVIEKRVGAPVAAECFVDRSPPVEPLDVPRLAGEIRDRGAGRPTKRDRRELDRLKGRRRG